jgi:hypothetical protein
MSPKEEVCTPAQVTSREIFDREEKYGAHNYHPLPVALCHGKGELQIINLTIRLSNLDIVISGDSS